MTDNVIPFPIRPAATPMRATLYSLSFMEVMYLRARFAHLGPWFTEAGSARDTLVNAVLLLDRNAQADLAAQAEMCGLESADEYLDCLLNEALFSFQTFMRAVSAHEMPPLIAPDDRARPAPLPLGEADDDGIPF